MMCANETQQSAAALVTATRRSRFPLFSLFALAALVLALAAASSAARAQGTLQSNQGSGEDKIVVGGGSVTVDMSVLDDLDRASGGRRPPLPDTDARQHASRIHLTPPGSHKTVAAKRTPKVPSRDIQAARPASRPAVPPKADMAGDRGDTASAGPANSAPPPPPPILSARGTSAEMPHVTPAPRTNVDERPLQPRRAQAPASTTAGTGPQGSESAAQTPEQTGFAPGTTRAIAFPAGQAELPKEGEDTLKAAAKAVVGDKQLRIQLKAYAAGDKNKESQARRLSLSRALSVRSFLIKEGVQATRIDVRALGNRVPSGSADRVDVTIASR